MDENRDKIKELLKEKFGDVVEKKGIGGMDVLFVPSISEFDHDDWNCSMIGCPSQCYRHMVGDDGKDYILYLRWRWEDPWQAHIITNAKTEMDLHNDDAEWSVDLFEESNQFFMEDEVEEAKESIMDIWEAYYK